MAVNVHDGPLEETFLVTAKLDEDLQEQLKNSLPGQLERGTVTLDIRHGESTDPRRRTRIISISPVLPDVSQDDLLAAGFVLDGAKSISLQVDHSVTAHVNEKHGDPVLLIERHQNQIGSLFECLQAVQDAIVEWLRMQGYQVEFS